MNNDESMNHKTLYITDKHKTEKKQLISIIKKTIKCEVSKR